MKQTLMAATASFAHLLGRPVAAKRAEEDDDKQREGESDEDYKKRKDEAASAQPAAEEGDEDDDAPQREDESDEDYKKRKDKAAAAETDDNEEGDDKSDGDDMRKKGSRPARLRERARCAAIFADAAAGKNPALAATLAFNTELPRSQAIKVLRAGGLAVTGQRNTLDRRMAANPIPAIDAGGGARAPAGGQSKAAQDGTAIIVAGMKRRGEPEAAIQAFVASRAA
jgi:hypothetical protein